MNSDVTRRLYTDSHLVAFDPEHRDDDIIADHHGFTHTSRQYQHRIVLHGLPSVFKPLGNETILTGIPPACGQLRDGWCVFHAERIEQRAYRKPKGDFLNHHRDLYIGSRHYEAIDKASRKRKREG